jgi:hypothetical protein
MRTAYVLTVNESSERSQFSKNVLETVGFCVTFVNCIQHQNKVLSNKLSMLHIYEQIANGHDKWAYVFEDDINVLEPISLNEIIAYEQLTSVFLYLGVCIPHYFTEHNKVGCFSNVNGTSVSGISGAVRGLHAIGISKLGARMLLDFAEHFGGYEYMDMILEKFSEIHPAPVVRFDLESYIHGHKGVFFQDRNLFPSSI